MALEPDPTTPLPGPRPERPRDWRPGSSLFVGALAALIALVVLAIAARELGGTATAWLVAIVLVAVAYARYWRLRYFTTQAFMHVKELTKAEQYEAHKAMRRRFFTTVRETRRQRPLGRVIDEGGMHPPMLIRVARPQHYVKLQVAPVPWPRLYDIRSVTVRWTPLVLFPTDEFFGQVTQAVAHFLCVNPRALVPRPPDLYRKQITFVAR